MQEAHKGGVVINSVRETGQTPRDAVVDYLDNNQQYKGWGPWKRPVGTSHIPPLPKLHFGSIELKGVDLFAENPYAVGVGTDEERVTLFRNDIILLANAASVRIVTHENGYTWLVATAESLQGKKSIHIFHDGNAASTPIENADSLKYLKTVGHKTDLDIAIVASKGEETTLMIVDHYGTSKRELKVPLVPDLVDINIEGVYDDLATIIWQVNRNGVTTVYRNEEIVVEKSGRGFVVKSMDHGSHLLIASTPEVPALIMLNSDTLFENAAYRVVHMDLSDEGDFIVANLVKPGEIDDTVTTSEIFYMTPARKGVEGPFAEIGSIFADSDLGIIAHVRDFNGVDRKLIIEDNDQDPEKSGLEDQPVVIFQQV